MNLLDTASLVVTPNGYKASKLYSIVPSDGSGDMTFARTGDTATRVNSSGLIETVLANKPRLDYLGSTCPKLLLEPQRTNVALYSEDFTNAYWTTNKSNITVTGTSGISPSGANNASKLIVTNGQTGGYIRANDFPTSASIYTASVFVKKSGFNVIRLVLTNYWSLSPSAYFNLDNQTTDSVSNCTAKIESFGNDWFRCSITASGNAIAGGGGHFYIYVNNSVTQTGDGVKGILAYGAQVEIGAYATSYIPTTTASVTRNGDTATKTSATALIGQTEGTLFFDIDYKGNAEDSYRLVLSDNSYNNFIYPSINASKLLSISLWSGGVNQGELTKSLTIGRHKIAFGYKLNNVVLYVDGQLISTDTSATMPASLTQMTIGGGLFGTSFGLYNSVALWKTRLQNSELATLSSL